MATLLKFAFFILLASMIILCVLNSQQALLYSSRIYIQIVISYCINTTKYCTKPIFCGIDAITVLLYGWNFSSHYMMILSHDNDVSCRKHCRMALRRLFLRIKIKVSVFLLLWVSLTACNIAKYCTLASH